MLLAFFLQSILHRLENSLDIVDLSGNIVSLHNLWFVVLGYI